MRRQLQLWLIFLEGGQKSDKLNSRAALWCWIRRRIPILSLPCPFPSVAFLSKIFVLWIWELYSHSLMLAFKSLGCSVTSHGRAGKGLMPQHQLITKILAKRNKRKEDSGCLCRDSVLSLPVDLKMKFECPQAWWAFDPPPVALLLKKVISIVFKWVQ